MEPKSLLFAAIKVIDFIVSDLHKFSSRFTEWMSLLIDKVKQNDATYDLFRE